MNYTLQLRWWFQEAGACFLPELATLVTKMTVVPKVHQILRPSLKSRRRNVCLFHLLQGPGESPSFQPFSPAVHNVCRWAKSGMPGYVSHPGSVIARIRYSNVRYQQHFCRSVIAFLTKLCCGAIGKTYSFEKSNKLDRKSN